MKKENERRKLKENEKLFTNNECNNIMKKNHNPLKVNYKNLFEKDGIYMRETKEIVLNEEDKILIKKYNKNEKFIKLLKKICTDLKIDNYKVEMERFLEKG